MPALEQINTFLQSYNLVPFQDAPFIYLILTFILVSGFFGILRDLIMCLFGTRETNRKLSEILTQLEELTALTATSNKRLKDIREESERLRETWE